MHFTARTSNVQISVESWLDLSGSVMVARYFIIHLYATDEGQIPSLPGRHDVVVMNVERKHSWRSVPFEMRIMRKTPAVAEIHLNSETHIHMIADYLEHKTVCGVDGVEFESRASVSF